jgi:hypothetical protein
MRAGGAASLAEHGVPPSIIQPFGRWSPQEFLIYIRKSPALIGAMLYSDRRAARLDNSRSLFPRRRNCSSPSRMNRSRSSSPPRRHY